MMSTRPDGPEFREGDEVVLAEGPYQGTQGVFIRLRQDDTWADITERNGSIRSHPVVWLSHFTDAIRSFFNRNQKLSRKDDVETQ